MKASRRREAQVRRVNPSAQMVTHTQILMPRVCVILLQEWEERRRQNIEKMNEEMEKIAEYERNQRVSATSIPSRGRAARPREPANPTPCGRRKACWSPTPCGTSWMTPDDAAGPWRSLSGTAGKAAAGTGVTGGVPTLSECAVASSRSGR